MVRDFLQGTVCFGHQRQQLVAPSTMAATMHTRERQERSRLPYVTRSPGALLEDAHPHTLCQALLGAPACRARAARP